MILEEAAGVSGLHSRRHEAELRLRAAETNMSRLDDVARELESALGRLKREARQAEKYKRLAAQIRSLQGAVLYARWKDASDALERVDDRGRRRPPAKQVEVATAAEAAVAHGRRLWKAEAGVWPPARRGHQIAGAVLQRLTLENDRMEREAQQAAAAVERLQADLARLEADRAREAQIVEDAGRALEAPDQGDRRTGKPGQRRAGAAAGAGTGLARGGCGKSRPRGRGRGPGRAGGDG